MVGIGQISAQVSCEILKYFVTDTTILKGSGIDVNTQDTITILDSSKAFKVCTPSFKSGNITTIITYNFSGYIFNGNIRTDVYRWKNHIIIDRVEKKGNIFKVSFWYKPTNENGYVKYKWTKNHVVPVKYSLGVF